MTNEKLNQEWVKMMGPIVSGHATLKMITAFDFLTSDMFGIKAITFDEFLNANTVISVAKQGAKAAQKAGLEGYFLVQEA